MSCDSKPKCQEREAAFFTNIISEIEDTKKSFGLNDKYIDLSDMAGKTTGRYIVLNLATTVRDPLYDEPINNEYIKEVDFGFELDFFYAFVGTTTTGDEKGKYKTFDTRIKILFGDWETALNATSEVTDKTIVPKIGDIVEMNGIKFDITSIDRDKDTGTTYDCFNLELIRHSKFTPERKMNT
jgi:hypothetical protein